MILWISLSSKASFVIPLIFYLFLCTTEYTWIFVSGDSGDWLASATWWMVPQPLGSPLYILLGKIISLIPNINLPAALTIILSVIPASITCYLVHKITYKLTNLRYLSTLSTFSLLASSIYLSQSTVLEEYAIATMCLVLAYWWYINNKLKLSMLALGLGTAIHAIILPIALIWFVVEWQRRKELLKCLWIYLLCLGFYALIPILMYLEKPPFLAGYLSWSSMYDYLFGTSSTIIGTLSIFDLPERLWRFTAFIVVNLGLGLIPIFYLIRYIKISKDNISFPHNPIILILLLTPSFFIWYFLTNLDPTTWTFLTFAMPFLVVIMSIGLYKIKLQNKTTAMNLTRGIILIATFTGCMNTTFLNPHHLSPEISPAVAIKASLEELPKDSVITCTAGCYSLCVFYTMADGREDLTPLVWSMKGEIKPYYDYLDYLETKKNIVGGNTTEQIRDALNKGRDVFLIGNPKCLDLTFASPEWITFVNKLQITPATCVDNVDNRIRRIIKVYEDS